MGRGMYALQSKPSRFGISVRIATSTALINLETREIDKRVSFGMSSPVNRPTFTSKAKYQNTPQNGSSQQPQYPAQHEEIVKCLSDEWNKVKCELDRTSTENTDGKQGVILGLKIIDTQGAPIKGSAGVTPFDLDKFLSERLYRHVTETS